MVKTALVLIGAFVWMLALNRALALVSSPNDVAVAIGLLSVVALTFVALALGGRYAKKFAQRIGPLAVLLFAATMATGCGTTVNPGYVGIQVDYYGKDKGVQSYPIVTGRVWYNPWTTSVLEYPSFVQTAKWTRSLDEGKAVNEEITFTNADGMSIAADISVSYHLETDKVPAFYVKFRSDNLDNFTHGFLRNLARDKFDTHGGRFRIDQIMGDNAVFVRDVRADLQTELDSIGVKIDQFGFIGSPRPPQQVIEAINAKVHANQLALQKQNELVQVQADALKAAAQAEGLARSAVATAQGKAEATRIAADADAYYNRTLAASLTPLLVENRRATSWDGKLPNVTSGAIPFINVK